MRGFGLLASLFGFQAPLRFGDGIGARFGFAIFRCFLFGSNSSLSIFLGLLLHSHHAGFFGGLNNFAGGCLDSLLVALAAINLFRRAELLLGFGQRGSGIFIGKSNVGDAHGIACFEKFQRRLAVNAEDGVFNLGVGGGISAAGNKFVAGIDVLDLRHRGVTHVFEDYGVARLGHGKIRLGGDDHAEGLHVGDGFDFARATLEHHFTEVHSTAFRRNGPQNISQIFEAELGGFVQPEEFHFDFDAVALVLHLGFAGGLLH